ncbi:TPA: HNH endonuclease [Citrobacter koseri]|nr:HNH endonuclease [Citrobacter koseri]
MAKIILSEFLVYDPTSKTGLRWKNDRGKMKAGTEAGSYSTTKGDYVVRLFRKKYAVHRVVWELVNGQIAPDYDIDHIDGDRRNNHVSNLRLATTSQNLWNMRTPSHNTSGVKGLCYISSRGLWLGQIVANGVSYKKKSKSRDVIENWLVETRSRVHGEFARHE